MSQRSNNRTLQAPDSAATDATADQEPSPITRALLPTAALSAASLFLALIEASRLAWSGQASAALETVGLGWYLGGLLIICGLAAIINLAPVAALIAATPPRSGWRRGLSLAATGLFAVFWHRTLMQGDGIQAHALYPAIFYGSLAAMMIGLVGYVYLVILSERVPLKWRRAIVCLTLLGALLVSNLILPSYVAFHGYLVAVELMLIGWLLYPWLSRRPKRAIVAALVAIGLLSIGAFVGSQNTTLRHVERYSHLPKSLSVAFAPSRILLSQQTDLFGEPSSLDADTLPQALAQANASINAEARGKNVLIIVLESTQAQTWQDPKMTPRFHQWKRHGVYFPRAIATYPATPLAYGAMFSSQPPSVLAQTPHWSDHRPFDLAIDRFDYLLLSQPDVSWFEHTAITQFFLPDEAPVHRHKNAKEGLSSMREALTDIGEDSFFGWVHLYEPHAPYKHHAKYGKKSGKAKAYETEIRYIDEHLGDFMDWFYTQPIAAETLVVIIGDHGEGLGEKIDGNPFWGHHVHVHNVLSNVPAYFSGPGLPTDQTRTHPNIGQIDVMPTILDYIGVSPSPNSYLQGWSLYSLLEQEPLRPLATQAFSIRGKKFFDFIGEVRMRGNAANMGRFETVLNEGRYSPKIALQYGPWKIHHDLTLDALKLYNTEEDPLEQKNLAVSHPDKLEEMTKRLKAWHDQQNWVVGAFNDGARSAPPKAERH